MASKRMSTAVSAKILSALIVSLIEYEYPTNGAVDMLTQS